MRERAFGIHSSEICGRLVGFNLYLQEDGSKMLLSRSVLRGGEEKPVATRSPASAPKMCATAVLVLINLSSNAVLFPHAGWVPCIMFALFRSSHVGVACAKSPIPPAFAQGTSADFALRRPRTRRTSRSVPKKHDAISRCTAARDERQTLPVALQWGEW